MEKGQLIEIDNGKEYIVISKIKKDDVDYYYLMSNFKPLEVRFAKETTLNGNEAIEIIYDKTLVQELLSLLGK